MAGRFLKGCEIFYRCKTRQEIVPEQSCRKCAARSLLRKDLYDRVVICLLEKRYAVEGIPRTGIVKL